MSYRAPVREWRCLGERGCHACFRRRWRWALHSIFEQCLGILEVAR